MKLFPEDQPGVLAQGRDDESGFHQFIGGYDGRPAGVGDQSDPVAGRYRLAGKGHGRLAHLLHIPEGDHPGSIEEEFGDDFLPGQPAGVGGDGLRPLRGASRLHTQHRLPGRYLDGGFQERRRIRETLHVNHDHLRRLVITPVADHLGDGDVAGIPVGGVHPHPGTQFDEPLIDHLGHPAALGHDRDRALEGTGEGEVAVGPHPGIGVDDALAVRPEHPDAVFTSDRQHLPFQLLTLAADLPETGRVHNHDLHTLPAALLHRRRNVPCRYHDVGQFHVPGDIEDGDMRPQAADLFTLRIDGMNGAGVAEVLEIPDDPVADREFLRRGTDHRHRAGEEESVQIM